MSSGFVAIAAGGPHSLGIRRILGVDPLSRSGVGAGTWGGVTIGGISPNPFRNRVRINYEVPMGVGYRVSVYDVKGRLLRELASGVGGGGVGRVLWDGKTGEGSRVVPGIYFVVIEAGGDSRAQKVIKVR